MIIDAINLSVWHDVTYLCWGVYFWNLKWDEKGPRFKSMSITSYLHISMI